MIYRMHFSDMARARAFGIVVDDETLTWASDPAGHDLTEPITGYFSRGGPVGSGKQFEVFPGGRARLTK
jgi:hypothetical protein